VAVPAAAACSCTIQLVSTHHHCARAAAMCR
jgi:hypothetical protein